MCIYANNLEQFLQSKTINKSYVACLKKIKNKKNEMIQNKNTKQKQNETNTGFSILC